MTGYKIVMSTGGEIKIDADEIENVKAGIRSGQMIGLKQGLVNPSFIVSVIADKDRADKIYDDGSVSKMPMLTNIFADLKLQLVEKMRVPQINFDKPNDAYYDAPPK